MSPFHPSKAFLRFAAPAVLSAAALSAQSADAILARHAQAMGGLEKLHAVRSMRLKGTMAVGQGVVLPLVMEVARPNKHRMEIRSGGEVFLLVFDGSKGWQTDPASGNLRPMTEAERRDAADSTFDGDLIEPQARGARAELLGRQLLDGRETFRIRLVEKDGTQSLHWVDSDLFLELKREKDIDTPEGRKAQVMRFSDFRLLEGVPTPFRLEVGVKFSTKVQIIQIEEAQVNPTIPDSDFTAPR